MVRDHLVLGLTFLHGTPVDSLVKEYTVSGPQWTVLGDEVVGSTSLGDVAVWM